MSSRHAKLIRAIFADPPSHNIHWRDVESLIRHVGADIEPLSGARVRVTKDRVESILFRPHHHQNTLDEPGIVHLRGFLARAGVTPSLYEAGDAPER
jgi:hypothetical protein